MGLTARQCLGSYDHLQAWSSLHDVERTVRGITSTPIPPTLFLASTWAHQQLLNKPAFFFFSDNQLLWSDSLDRTRPCGLWSIGFVECSCFVPTHWICVGLSRGIIIIPSLDQHAECRCCPGCCCRGFLGSWSDCWSKDCCRCDKLLLTLLLIFYGKNTPSK